MATRGSKRKLIHTDEKYAEKCGDQQLLQELSGAVRDIYTTVLSVLTFEQKNPRNAEEKINESVNELLGEAGMNQELINGLNVNANFFELSKLLVSGVHVKDQLKSLETCIAFFFAKMLFQKHGITDPSMEVFCAVEKLMLPQMAASRQLHRDQYPRSEFKDDKEAQSYYNRYDQRLRRTVRKFEAQVFLFVSSDLPSCLMCLFVIAWTDERFPPGCCDKSRRNTSSIVHQKTI